MEDTLAQINEALGSIHYQEASAPATEARSDAQQQPAYAPSDRGALLRRLQTFRPSTWFAKPPPLSAVACALRGWRNVGADLLSCEFCGAKVLCHLPAVPQAESAAAAIAQYSGLLTDSHDGSCPWKHRSCDHSLLTYPPAPERRLRTAFDARAAALQRLDLVPRVAPAAAAELAAAATAAAAPRGAAAATAAAAPATDTSAGGWAVHALATLLAVPQQQLLSHTQPAPVDGMSADSPQHELSEHQQVLLLALCGWDVSTLPQRSSSSKVLLQRSASPLAHLVQPAAGGSSSGMDQICSSEAMLRCSECGASAGLWTLNCVGPLYLKALQSNAARAKALDVSGSPADLAARRASPGAASPGVTAGTISVTSWAAGGGGEADGAAAQSLYQTIAGGDLVAAPKLPKRRFGSESGDAVFGLGAFEVEAKRRRSEGSFGGSEYGGSRAASEPRSDVASQAPSPAPSPAPAPGLAQGFSGGGAGDAGAAGAGTDATAADAHATPGAGATSAAAGAGGAIANGRPSSVERRAPTPPLPPARQLSLLGAGSMGAAQAHRPLLDPVQEHRPWCPWMHAPTDPAATAAAAAAAASTATTSAAASTATTSAATAALAGEAACGWLHCLRALAARGVCGAGPVLAGAPGAMPGADCAAADVAAGGSSMEDYGAKVRSALGAMYGAG